MHPLPICRYSWSHLRFARWVHNLAEGHNIPTNPVEKTLGADGNPVKLEVRNIIFMSKHLFNTSKDDARQFFRIH